MDGIQAHRITLKDRHADLERQIEHEMRRPLPDSTAISSMKKKKLQLKEELKEFEN